MFPADLSLVLRQEKKAPVTDHGVHSGLRVENKMREVVKRPE